MVPTSVASTGTDTFFTVELTVSSAPLASSPRCACTAPTRTSPDCTTTSPMPSTPVAGIPTRVCQRLIAAMRSAVRTPSPAFTSTEDVVGVGVGAGLAVGAAVLAPVVPSSALSAVPAASSVPAASVVPDSAAGAGC
jgi:hypothetical protein